jgi:hypothetical protein
MRQLLLTLAIGYTAVHVAASGIYFPLRTPNVGQVIEELQPIYRQVALGTASVDQPRQYGATFLFLFDPVYRRAINRPSVVAAYGYLLDIVAIAVAFWAVLASLKLWMEGRGRRVSRTLLIWLVLLWANFGPLYGVLAIKNVELWEVAFVAVACLSLMRGKRWTAAWCLAAASLTKMLPLVYLPYLLIRDRRAFAYSVVALCAILTAAEVAYGRDMGWAYLPHMVRAGAGSSGFGNGLGMTWHENVTFPGLVSKAFGYLEKPDPDPSTSLYPRGYYVLPLPGWQKTASVLATVLQMVGLGWSTWMLRRRRGWSPADQTLWDFAFIGAMMLVLAPQGSQDYMVLTLAGFSLSLAACESLNTRDLRASFVVALLLVANVAPRGLFSRAVLIDPLMRITGYTHFTRAEAYQYFGFPLLGLLLLVYTLVRVRDIDDQCEGVRRVDPTPNAYHPSA